MSLFDATLANGVGCVSRKRFSSVLWERGSLLPGLEGVKQGMGKVQGAQGFSPRGCAGSPLVRAL